MRKKEKMKNIFKKEKMKRMKKKKEKEVKNWKIEEYILEVEEEDSKKNKYEKGKMKEYI